HSAAGPRVVCLLLLCRTRPPPRSPLFPYTTLFRSAPPPGAGLERSERRRGEREHPVARRLEVVEQPHPSRGDARAERRLVDLPGEIGRDAPPVDDGSGDAEAGGIDPESPRGGEEARHGVLERRKLTARELRLALEHERTVAAVEQGERRLGPADVAGEEHYFLAPA